MTLPEDGKLHLQMFIGSCIGRDRKNGLSFVWVSTIRYIWHIRNKVIFNGMDLELPLALDTIQYKSWIWLKGRIKNFCFTLYEDTLKELCFAMRIKLCHWCISDSLYAYVSLLECVALQFSILGLVLVERYQGMGF